MERNAQANADGGQWKCVDNRPFECPNDHGIMETESSLSVYCPQCNYSRTVFEFVRTADKPCPCCGGVVEYDEGTIWECRDCGRSYDRKHAEVHA